MSRYVCLHGHFYQPPRENPWLEEIPRQPSAAPYHDWNRRIAAECYRPNAAARILDAEGRIVEIADNYSKISFNFGPTLLSWLEAEEPEVYGAVLEADRRGRERFDGHGCALAQPYNHVILPLAKRRDKRTQFAWGLKDFEARFERRAEGVWLPETAVDLETLEVAAEAGMRFVVLAPHQGTRVRPRGGEWSEQAPDSKRPYAVRLPSGRALAAFFYDGPISRALAFEGLLSSGEELLRRLKEAFDAREGEAQLVHVATDGETYGHHHKHGEMALAYALKAIEERGWAKLANYGQYLERHPPQWEVQVAENTSWSCSHGIERWRSHCGCRTGNPHWTQAWRRPLRDSLDALRDSLDAFYEESGRALLKDPWAARDAYGSLLARRERAAAQAFLLEHAGRELEPAEAERALKLLEMQRNAQLMYTSCGWFFDDISGLESAQILLYAARAVAWAKELGVLDIDRPFLRSLEGARGNQGRTGREIYEQLVAESAADPAKFCAQEAIASFWEPGLARERGSYRWEASELSRAELASLTLIHGRARWISRLSWETRHAHFAAAYWRDQSIQAAVRFAAPDSPFPQARALGDALENGDAQGVLRALESAGLSWSHSLRALLPEERRRVLERMAAPAARRLETLAASLSLQFAPVLAGLEEAQAPVPESLRDASRWVSRLKWLEALSADPPDARRISALLEKSRERTDFDGELAGALRTALKRMGRRLQEEPLLDSNLKSLTSLLRLIRSMPWAVDFWDIQNAYARAWESLHASPHDTKSEPYRRFLALEDLLGMRLAAARKEDLEGESANASQAKQDARD